MTKAEVYKTIGDLRQEVETLKEAAKVKEAYYQSGWAADDKLQATLYQLRLKDEEIESLKNQILTR